MGKHPLLLLMAVDAEGTHQVTGLTRLGFKEYIAQHEVLLSAGKGTCTQALMKQFRAPEDSQAPLPMDSQLKGCQPAPGDLTNAKR